MNVLQLPPTFASLLAPEIDRLAGDYQDDTQWIAQDFQWYGGALDLMQCPDHEAIISGPYETGKTIAA